MRDKLKLSIVACELKTALSLKPHPEHTQSFFDLSHGRSRNFDQVLGRKWPSRGK
jgi:hypothetical protein